MPRRGLPARPSRAGRARASPAHDRARRAWRRSARSRRSTSGDAQPAALLAREHRNADRSARPRARHRNRHRHPALAAGLDAAIVTAAGRRARRRSIATSSSSCASACTSCCTSIACRRPPSSTTRCPGARARGRPAPPGSSTRCCARSRAPRDALGLPPRPGPAASRQEALAYLGITHSHPDWLVARWLDRYGFDAAAAWTAFNNAAAAADAARQPARRLARRPAPRRWTTRASTTDPTPYAPDGLVVQQRHACRAAPAVASRSRTKRRSSCRCWSARGPATACSTSAPRPAARPRRWPRRWTAAAWSSRATRGRAACACSPTTVRDSGAPNVRARAGGQPRRRAVPAGLRPRAGGRAVLGPRHGAARSRHPLAADRGAARRVRRGPAPLLGRAARGASRPAAASSTPPARASPRRTRRWSTAFLAAHPDFTLVDLRGRRAALAAVTDARGMLRTLPFAHGLEAFFAAALVRS